MMTSEESDETELVLDETWIKEFEENDKLYEKYYLDDLDVIKIHCVYVDADSNIVHTREERFLMKQKNVLTKEELMGIVQKHSDTGELGKPFKLQSIMKYNIDLEPHEIEGFLRQRRYQSYLSPVHQLEDVPFHRTISMFQDLNDLFLVYREKTEKKTTTRRHAPQTTLKKTCKQR